MAGRRLNKLREMPSAEIRGRARQEFLKLEGRFLDFSGREMTDRQLVSHFRREANLSSAQQAAEFVLAQLQQAPHPQRESSRVAGLFPALSHRTAIVEAMARRFPTERSAVIRKADNACLGCFDLMGFDGISFGNPIDWRLDPISRKRTPLRHWSRIDYLDAEVAGDKKITWELNRHQHFVTLGQAYSITGDEKYAAAFADQIASWMDANPPGLGINWASSLELALRLVSWMWALHLFSGSERVTPRLVCRLLKFVIAQARHIDRFSSCYFSPNTHLTGEALGLLYCGAALPDLDLASRWRARGIRIMLEQLPVQLLQDGVYFERSTYYHRYTADFYTHLLLLTRADSTGLDGVVAEHLAAMLDHLMWISRPDGRFPLIGDDDGGRLISLAAREADDFRDTLCTGAAILGRGDWKRVAGDAAVETLWLLGPEGLSEYDSIRDLEPEGRERGFHDGGFYVMRDGWGEDATCVILSGCRKPIGSTAHIHSDALSFELAAMGNAWLLDPGTFTYTGSSVARDEFRSANTHNAAIVDGLSASEPDGAFSWKTVASGAPLQFSGGQVLSYFRGSHNGYLRLADPVGYARQFALIWSPLAHRRAQDPCSYLVISDDFISKGPHRYEVNFTFDPVCSVTNDGEHLVAQHPNHSRLEMLAGATAPVELRLKEALVSRCYGKCEPASSAVIRSDGSGLQQIVSLIVPLGTGDNRGVRLSSARDQGSIELTAGWAHCEDKILIANSLCGSPAGCGRLNGSMGFTRRRLGVLESAVLVDGDRLELDDISLFSSTALEQCEVVLSPGSAIVSVQSHGALDLEVRIAGQQFHVEAPAKSEKAFRRFDLPLASVRSIGN